MAPLLGTFAGASAKAFGMLAAALKPIQDLFTRTTTVSLGNATSGQTWINTRGTWFANGSAAQSDDAASTYPLSSIVFKQDATLKADTTGGVGLAFWVTDSSNWWGAVPFYSSVSNTTTVSCSAGYGTYSSTGVFGGCGYTTNPGTSTCNGNCLPGQLLSSCCNPGAAVPTTVYTTTCTCSTGVTYNPTTGCPATYITAPPQICQALGGTYNFVGGTCNLPAVTPTCSTTSTTTYSCCTSYTTTATTYTGYTSSTSSTVTTYSTSIRVISSVSGSVVTDSTTSLTSNTSSYTNLASMEVATSSGSITAKGYSATGQVTQLGSTVSRSPSSPIRGSSVGIIKAPTDANQGSTLDNYSVAL